MAREELQHCSGLLFAQGLLFVLLFSGRPVFCTVPRDTDHPCALTLDRHSWLKSSSTGAKAIEVVSK